MHIESWSAVEKDIEKKHTLAHQDASNFIVCVDFVQRHYMRCRPNKRSMRILRKQQTHTHTYTHWHWVRCARATYGNWWYVHMTKFTWNFRMREMLWLCNAHAYNQFSLVLTTIPSHLPCRHFTRNHTQNRNDIHIDGRAYLYDFRSLARWKCMCCVVVAEARTLRLSNTVRFLFPAIHAVPEMPAISLSLYGLM